LSSSQEYECAICGYKSSNRAEFVEFKDPVKLPKVVDKARGRGRGVKPEDVKYICIKCSVEMYQEERKLVEVVEVFYRKWIGVEK
jgi:DNA-directed RNA polymerase subunit RPC12/RpoP